MDGTLAKCITLATHATVWLRGESNTVPRLDLAHPAFRFTASVDFDGADSIGMWLTALRSNAVDRVWLAIPSLQDEGQYKGLPAHLAASFAGGLEAGLLSIGQDGRRLWLAHPTVGDRDAPEQRIWLVSFRSQLYSAMPQLPDPGGAATSLDEALLRATDFAGARGLDGWAAVFRRARRTAGGSNGEPTMSARLLPAGWNGEARQLIDTVAAAWVFGGMGSWNDVGFADPPTQSAYQRVTQELYAAVMRAAVAAVNIELP
jgi:hypothetical protein